MSERRSRKRRSLSKIVEADPIKAEGYELVPLVRVTKHIRRRAFVGGEGIGGQGQEFVRFRPVAILDRSEAGERRLPIHNETVRLVRGLVLVALFLPALVTLLVHLTSRAKDNVHGMGVRSRSSGGNALKPAEPLEYDQGERSPS